MNLNNAMLQLDLYKHNKTWMFDDDRKDIIAEPFVMGMSEMIDHYVGDSSIKETTITFSKNEFPGSNVLLLLNEEANGGWYLDPKSKLKGWLCPVTRIYLNGIPSKIYFSVQNKNQKQNIWQSISKKIKNLMN